MKSEAAFETTDLAIMTVDRPKVYIRDLIESLKLTRRIRVVVGSPNDAYLAKLRENPLIEVITARESEWNKIKDCQIRQRAAWNYWRCLTLGPINSDRGGLLLLEDDVMPSFGWERRLGESLDEIHREFGERFVLTLYSTLQHSSDRKLSDRVAIYPTDQFACTQAVYYPEAVRASFARFLKRYGVNSYCVPYDLVLRVFLLKRGIPILATTPSLVQHCGQISTGLGDFHRSPTFRPSLQDNRKQNVSHRGIRNDLDSMKHQAKGQKIILRNNLSPGDIVMLTAAVRDLHKAYPDRFITDVRTPCDHLWENNPYLTHIDDDDPEATTIQCEYPLIHQSNETPHHFIHAFIHFLNDKLDLHIKATKFKGDIYISNSEKSWYSQIREKIRSDVPFWIVTAGGKYDFTVKWWEQVRFQQVVNHFRDRVLFVQVGEKGHFHPPLSGVIDLREQTDLRQFVRLMYHAQGALCPVTFTMHLAAAVEVKGGRPKNRPCVVVAGGREPSQWEAYPHHQYIHTNGALSCCDNGGCWKSRTKPIGDGDKKDQSSALCVDVVGDLPRCMDMITVEDVCRRIELYFGGGICRYLTPSEAKLVQPFLSHPGAIAN